MYMILNEEVERLLCCSLCKSELIKHAQYFVCKSCGLRFPKRVVKTGEKQQEFVFDFRILRPTYCLPEGIESWGDAQSKYEQYHERRQKSDSLKKYLNEIRSVHEIYTTEYHIEGKVLDVGGHQGRLRHYLGDAVSLYVSADPYINIFSSIGQQPYLLQAYSCLSEPCNFISAHAEYLPFKSGSFDWIHMRSVVDHFADPYLAFLEAYRCSKVNGRLLVGLAIIEKMVRPATVSLPVQVTEKFKQDGFFGLLRLIFKRIRNLRTLNRSAHHKDDHMFRLTHGTLIDLFGRTGWDIVKEHWQKPPFGCCIYACGQKSDPLILAHRDRTASHKAALPHHPAYGSVKGGSADQAESDPGEQKTK